MSQLAIERSGSAKEHPFPMLVTLEVFQLRSVY